MTKKETPKEPSSFTDLFTRETANQGRKMPIKTIDGKETDGWLLVLGSQSDVWANTKAEYLRSVITSEDGEGDEPELSLYTLVAAWSYDEECTSDNVQKLFDNAPYIKDAVNYFSSKEANLVKKD